MTAAAIIQARMTSTRLPGKVLERLGDTTLLGQVLRRAKAIAGVDIVVCAVPEGAPHDPIAAEAGRHGAAFTRGPEADVLERYRLAAEATGADVILRVTSDCPLIDPAVCARVITLVAEGGADYAANNLSGGWPHGLDCEAFSRDALERAAREADEPRQREHVTPWLRSHPSIRRADLPGPGGEAAHQRLTVDFPEDLAFARAVFDAVPGGAGPADLAELLRLINTHPHLASMNAMHREKSRPQTVKEAT